MLLQSFCPKQSYCSLLQDILCVKETDKCNLGCLGCHFQDSENQTAFLPSLALSRLRSPLALSASFQGNEFSTADGKALCCMMCCWPELGDMVALQRPSCPTFILHVGDSTGHTNLQELQGCPWMWAVALLHKATSLCLGNACFSPLFLMTHILADCCTLSTTNPTSAIGFGLED